MLLFVGDNTNSSSVTTTCHHNSVTSVVFDDFCDLSSADVDNNSVIDFGISSWSSDGSGIVGHQVMDSFDSSANLLHLAQFVSSFISSDSVANKSTFDIIKKSEEFPCLLNGDNIHETNRVGFVSTYTTINLD